MKNKSVLLWLWRVSGADKIKIALITKIQVLLGGSAVLSAWFLRGIIDSAVEKDMRGFWYYGILLIGLTLGQIILRAGLRHFSESCKSSLENRFKHKLFGALLGADYGSVNSVHSGEWMNRLTSDTKVVADGLTDILPGACGMAVKLFGAIFMLMALLPGFWMPIIIGGGALVLLTFIFRKQLKKLHKEAQEADGDLRAFMTEELGAMLVIRAFGKEETAEKGVEEKTKAHRSARMKRNIFSNVCNMGFGTAIHGAYVLGVLFCGYGILNGTMTYGSFTAVLQLITQIQAPFANLSGFVPRYYSMVASAERLMEAEAFPKDSKEKSLTKEEAKKLYSELLSIEFKNISFTYPGDSISAIENLSMSIEKGSYVALTGRSGRGKSTVLKLLLSLYPVESGERFVLTKEKTEALSPKHRALFAFVPQGNMLMSGTIREVLTFGEKSFDEGEIWRALEVACAADFVKALENGLNTKLSDRGSGLSEGQMQRLAIARAVLSQRPILLLDEATSALDEATEAKVLENLKAMTDKTVVIVTHRPAALAICDREVSFG